MVLWYTTKSSCPSVDRPRLVSYSLFETIDRGHAHGSSGEAATNEGARLLICIIYFSLAVRGSEQRRAFLGVAETIEY